MSPDGERVEVPVERWLIQLGFGPHVQQVMHGPEVVMYNSMKAMVVKFSVKQGWPLGPHPASIAVSELNKYVPVEALSEILPRNDSSVAFLVHADYIDVLLRTSGKNGVYIKEKQSNALELLWLDETFDLQSAVAIGNHTKALGIVEKGRSNTLRYAIRFRTLEDLTFPGKMDTPKNMGNTVDIC